MHLQGRSAPQPPAWRTSRGDIARTWAGRGEIMVRSFAASFEPGMRVRHPDQPGWGAGTVQSVDGHRVTVTFEEVGKVLVNTAVVGLEPLGDEDIPLQTPAERIK